MLLKGSKTEINLKKAFEEKAQFSRREIKTSNVEHLNNYLQMYAKMADTAIEEGFDEIADWFKDLDKSKSDFKDNQKSLKSIDPNTVNSEMRRVFETCKECRKCFDKCETFPNLFDLIDKNEVSEINSSEFEPVIDSCTLCDNCNSTCPYSYPHEVNLDFPRMVLEYRAMRRSSSDPV